MKKFRKPEFKLNWPNRLTLLRLVLVPVVMALILVAYYVQINVTNTDPSNAWFSYHGGLTLGSDSNAGGYHIPVLMMVAGIIFVVASCTDFLDGYIARKYNQVTDFGKFFDPIADKLLVNATLILLAVTKMLPVWMVVILILRDIFVDFIRMTVARKGTTLAAGIWGKLKTVFQMLGITLVFFVSYLYFQTDAKHGLGNEYKFMNQLVMIPMYLATFFSLFSGAVYFKQGFKDLFSTNAKVQ